VKRSGPGPTLARPQARTHRPSSPISGPANIFTVAEQFWSARNRLNSARSPRDVRMAAITCSAFALELYLECLIALETGKAPTS
jgi:hypothetical protein